MRRAARSGELPAELVAIWALVAVESLAVLVTYWRLPARALYHVSGSGLDGGAGRVLVYVNWPVALLAIAIVLVLADRLGGRGARVVAGVAVGFSSAIFVPGVVDESDLDAKWVNSLAAIGVLLALALTVHAWRTLGRPARPAAQPGDAVRVAIAVPVLLLAVPWLAADLGFYLDGVPVLGTLYQSGALRTQPGVSGLHPAVHHGYHHGTGGVLLVLGALLLSRVLPSVVHVRLRRFLAACLALMFCYGVGNIANDFWLEQVVKRGWTDWEIPDVTTPQPSVAWGVIVAAAGAIWAGFLLRDRRATPSAAADAR